MIFLQKKLFRGQQEFRLPAGDLLRVTSRGSEEAPTGRGTMAGEILTLKKLVDDGVHSAAGFECAKGKLLEPAGERRAIGFGG